MFKFNAVVVSSFEKYFALEYSFKGQTYTIEVAKFEHNENWKVGENVSVKMEVI